MKLLGTHRKTKVVVIAVVAYLLIVGIAKLAQPQHSNPLAVTPQSEPISTAAIYNDVNAARHAAGAPILSLNPLAIKAAEEKCQDMVTNDYYAHTSPATGDIGYVYAEKLIPNGIWFNENLNEGNLLTNQAWVDSWLNSPGHKATMLDPRFTDTGLAICHRPSSPLGVSTVVQEFVQIAPAQVQTTAPTTNTPVVCTTTPAAGSSMTICR